MDSAKEFLGKRIQELRKNKKLTQPALAEKIGVDGKYISRIETGSSYPSLDTIDSLAEALEVEVKELFNFQHLKDREELVNIINQRIKTANTKDIRLIYKIINDVAL